MILDIPNENYKNTQPIRTQNTKQSEFQLDHQQPPQQTSKTRSRLQIDGSNNKEMDHLSSKYLHNQHPRKERQVEDGLTKPLLQDSSPQQVFQSFPQLASQQTSKTRSRLQIDDSNYEMMDPLNSKYLNNQYPREVKQSMGNDIAKPLIENSISQQIIYQSPHQQTFQQASKPHEVHPLSYNYSNNHYVSKNAQNIESYLARPPIGKIPSPRQELQSFHQNLKTNSQLKIDGPYSFQSRDPQVYPTRVIQGKYSSSERNGSEDPFKPRKVPSNNRLGKIPQHYP